MSHPDPDIQFAMDSFKTNSMAEMAPVGGQYTSAGVQKASRESRLNAIDRLRAKYLIGIGGTMARRTGENY